MLNSLNCSLNVPQTFRNAEASQKDVIGEGTSFLGPFGWINYIYADYTASGKGLAGVEAFIAQNVLPNYANTHTTVSRTSLQTTIYRQEAREIVKRSVGGCAKDEVIFCGSGATGAIHKLLHSVSRRSTQLIVFVGPFEHHSNLLPWRETAHKVIRIPIDSQTGQVDLINLTKKLKQFSSRCGGSRRKLIGCFSAGSNISGAVSDDIAITKLLHKYGALSFWDYAGAAPHVDIAMNPGDSDAGAWKDAVFFSGHKFLGGPQTPGVLVVKSHVLSNPVPHGVGGGTVLFATRNRHEYVRDLAEREEGGTPDIIGSIRLGLIFLARNRVGIERIMQKEAAFTEYLLKELRKVEEVVVLGDAASLRLPIISFLIKHLHSGYFLHHNFVVALLNDLFGIQCRGGCMCAGPYAQDLLGIEDTLARQYENELKMGHKSGENNVGAILKPGFIRISLSYHSTPEEIRFIVDSIKFIAKHGWKLLPIYMIDWKSGVFTVKGYKPLTTSLHDCAVSPKPNLHQGPSYFTMLKLAKQLVSKAWTFRAPQDPVAERLITNKRLKALRSFMLPIESFLILNHSHTHPETFSCNPFRPGVYPKIERIVQLKNNPLFYPLSIPFLLSKASSSNHLPSAISMAFSVYLMSEFAPHSVIQPKPVTHKLSSASESKLESDDDGIFMH